MDQVEGRISRLKFNKGIRLHEQRIFTIQKKTNKKLYEYIGSVGHQERPNLLFINIDEG